MATASVPFVWLHHPASAVSDFYSDSDEETSDDFVVGTVCAVCETAGTCYTILDRDGKRLPNPYIQYALQKQDTEGFTPPVVPHHAICTQYMPLYKTSLSQILSALQPYLPILPIAQLVVCQYLTKPNFTFYEFVADTVGFI